MLRRCALIVALTAALVVVPSALTSAALVSHWSLDEGAGQIAGDSAGSNAGTLGTTGAVAGDDPTWTASAKIGPAALSFDNVDDLVRIPHAAALNGATGSGYTVSGWVRVNAAGQSAWFDKSINSSSGGGIHNRVGVATDTTARAFSGHVAGASDFADSSANAVSTGVWTHVVAANNGTAGLQLYLNGVANGSATTASPNAGNAVDLFIGAAPALGSVYVFDGLIDDIGFWNEDLNAGYVLALYNLGNEPNLNYDVGQVQQLYDLFEAAAGFDNVGGNVWEYNPILTGTPGVVQNLGLDQNNVQLYGVVLDPSGTGGVQIHFSFAAAVPEPGAWTLVGPAVLGLAWAVRRRTGYRR